MKSVRPPSPYLVSISFALLMSGFMMTGCVKETPPPKATGDPRSQTAMVTVEGSSTMSQLLKEWSDRFMKEHPDVPISLTADDSADGISALIEGKVDIAAASRELTDEENNLARVNGIRLKRVAVARDCLAVIVNPDNKIRELTINDVKGIFTGSIINWKTLGGPDRPIVLFIREASSGTNRYFKEHILGGEPYSDSATVEPSSDGLISKVEAGKDAVGYVGLGHALKTNSKVKILRLRLVTERGQSVAPSKASSTDDYPISRPLYLFADTSAKPSVDQFIKFCLSDSAQDMVADSGYVSVSHPDKANHK